MTDGKLVPQNPWWHGLQDRASHEHCSQGGPRHGGWGQHCGHYMGKRVGTVKIICRHCGYQVANAKECERCRHCTDCKGPIYQNGELAEAHLSGCGWRAAEGEY